MHELCILQAAQAAGLTFAATGAEAHAVSAFLLQPGLFGTRLTPGEQEEFQTRPTAVVGSADDTYWYRAGSGGAVMAVLGVRTNYGRTGIYEISAFAVHHTVRGRGVGRAMLQFAVEFTRGMQGRGLLFETSSDPAYTPMHVLLRDEHFTEVGCFPDFYYPGEDTLWYYRSLTE